MNKTRAPVARALIGLSIVLVQGSSWAGAAGGGESAARSTREPLQIVHRTELKVVIQVNYAETLPNGLSKQVLAAKNLYDQYEALGMKSGVDYDIAMVFRGEGAQFLLTDDAYDLKVKTAHPKGNPSAALIAVMSRGGVQMYECAVAMKLKGYEVDDLQPIARIVSSGIGALVDFQKSGFLAITP